jgi:hypothetical protein
MTLFEYSAARGFPQLENKTTACIEILIFQWFTVLAGLTLKALSGTFSSKRMFE